VLTIRVTTFPIAYDQCVTDTTAMNLSIGPDGTIQQDPSTSNTTTAGSAFCNDPASRSNPCYGSICTGEWASECYRKLDSGALGSRKGGLNGWSTALMAMMVGVVGLML
jgi:hypothetical protein